MNPALKQKVETFIRGNYPVERQEHLFAALEKFEMQHDDAANTTILSRN